MLDVLAGRPVSAARGLLPPFAPVFFFILREIMKLYLSGKITGNEDYKKEFAYARLRLEDAGFSAADPADFGLPEDISWQNAMKYAIREMLACDGLALLDTWRESEGARIEVSLARELGFPVKPVEEWLWEGCPGVEYEQ
jgi:hypothetical protein